MSRVYSQISLLKRKRKECKTHSLAQIYIQNVSWNENFSSVTAQGESGYKTLENYVYFSRDMKFTIRYMHRISYPLWISEVE